jgi:hypothetical protein
VFLFHLRSDLCVVVILLLCVIRLFVLSFFWKYCGRRVRVRWRGYCEKFQTWLDFVFVTWKYENGRRNFEDIKFFNGTNRYYTKILTRKHLISSLITSSFSIFPQESTTHPPTLSWDHSVVSLLIFFTATPNPSIIIPNTDEIVFLICEYLDALNDSTNKCVY